MNHRVLMLNKRWNYYNKSYEVGLLGTKHNIVYSTTTHK